MIGQSKNAFQAEIDAACELVDFLRFNVEYIHEIYTQSADFFRWRMESYGVSPFRGICFCYYPIQFYGYCR